LALREDTYNSYRFPPLPGLMLNYFNNKADDGYSGTLIHVTEGIGNYAGEQINQPSATYWNIDVEDVDQV